MFVVLGATGHIGSAVVEELLRAGESVTAVVRDERKADGLRARGAHVAAVDVGDPDALRDVLRTGRRAFLLNPPAPVTGDTDAEERRTASAIVQALERSELEKVVAQSTYGAQPGGHKGDLGTLFEFEEALRAQPIPTTIQRGAYYMSNWDATINAARQGTLPTMFPADFVLPMVAPDDLGRSAARFLREGPERTGLRYVEGPARHSPRDVADAFAHAIGRPVEVVVTPRERWIDTFLGLGFSEEAATSYAGMTAVSLDGRVEIPNEPERGATTLADYVERLVERSGTGRGG